MRAQLKDTTCKITCNISKDPTCILFKRTGSRHSEGSHVIAKEKPQLDSYINMLILDNGQEMGRYVHLDPAS